MAYLEDLDPCKDKQIRLVFLPSGRIPPNLQDFGPDPERKISRVAIKNKKIYYSPEERAEFLYEAITAKDEKGNYLYNNIYLEGGHGAEDTICALEKLLKDKKATLPERADNLNIFGFSDASQFHHYFGQRGIATPIYYSGSTSSKLYPDLINTLKKQKQNETFFMHLTIVNNPKKRKAIKGLTQPGAISHIEHKPTHQLQVLPNQSNILILELANHTQINRLAETLDQMKDKDITLVLSKDMSPKMIEAVKERFPHLTIFSGALVGHGNCSRKKGQGPDSGEGKPIPLFASGTISIAKDGTATMQITPKSSPKAKELSDPRKHPKRRVKIKEDPKNTTTLVTIKDGDAAGRVILSDPTKIKQGQPHYTIQIGRTDPNFAWQKMELSIKELLELGIINPTTLQQLEFIGDCNPDALWRGTARIMKELVSMYLPKLKSLRYNNTEIPVKRLNNFLAEKAAALDWASAPKRHERETEIIRAEKSGTPLSVDEIIKLRKNEEKARLKARTTWMETEKLNRR